MTALRARALILLAVLLSAWWFQVPGIANAMMRDWVDDAFFYLLVADGVVEGRGSTSDGIGATNGYHPLWMGIHVAARAVTADPLPILAALQFLLLAAALLLLHAWLAPLAGPTVALFVCLLAVFERTFARVLSTGMETHLAFVALLAVLLLLRNRAIDQMSGRRWLALQGALLCLLFSRLDGGLCWVALAVILLRRHGVGLVARLFAAPAAVAATYLVFNVVRFGSAMPISGRIKAGVGFGLDRLVLLFVPQTIDWPRRLTPWDPLRSLESGLFFGLYLLGVAVLVMAMFLMLARRGRLELSLRLLVGYALLHTAYYTVLQQDRYSLSWARGPELLLVVTALTWLVSLLPRPADASPSRLARVALAGALLAVFAAMWTHQRDEARHCGTIRDYTTSIDQFHEGVAWIRAHTGEREVIASESIGFLGWFADRPIVSLDGLLNSVSYFHEYLRAGRVGAYLHEHGVRYVAQALRKDVEPIPYMSGVLHVSQDALRVVASFDGTSKNPRRYLVFELLPEAAP